MRIPRLFALVAALIAAGSGSSASGATLTLAGSPSEFEVTYCRTDPHAYGQLAIEAEVTAVGTLRGEPTALLLTKVAGAEVDHVDLYLMELSEELQGMRPVDVTRKVMTDHATLHSQRVAELSAEFSQAALADLPLEEMMARSEEHQAQLEALEEEMQALQPPKVRSFGTVTVDGSTVRFTGRDTRVIDGKSAAALAALGSELRMTAQCKN